MAQTLPNDLRSCIASKEALVVVGAGVSIASAGETDVASWTGLLRNGVARCAEVCGDLPAGWSERVLAEIESGDMDDLLSAAEKVSRKLGAPDSGEYSRWLRETAGSLRVRNPDLIRALSRLEVPLATTNYDALLEQVTGRSAITWRDAARFERFIRGDEDASFAWLLGATLVCRAWDTLLREAVEPSACSSTSPRGTGHQDHGLCRLWGWLEGSQFRGPFAMVPTPGRI